MAVWPPSSAPMAHGLPGSPGAARQRVVGSLAVRAADRVNRRQVEHVEAHRRDVGQPRLGLAEGAAARGSGVHERGNISYHALNRARTGSTVTRSARSYDRGRRCDRGAVASSARSSGSRAAATRAPAAPDCAGRRRARSRVRRSPAGAGRVVSSRDTAGSAAAAWISSAPSSSSLATSCPASALAMSPLSHVPNRSIHAFDRVLVAAELGDGERRAPGSLPSGVERNLRATSAGLRSADLGGAESAHGYFSTPASRSWPSANSVGRDDDDFARRALDRKRPASISGCTRSTTTRGDLRLRTRRRPPPGTRD